jgi:hypothetical protein
MYVDKCGKFKFIEFILVGGCSKCKFDEFMLWVDAVNVNSMNLTCAWM